MRGAHRADRPERDRRIDHPHACAEIEGAEKLTVLGIAGQPLGDCIAQDIAEGGDTAAEHHDLGIPRQRQQQHGAAETTDHSGPQIGGRPASPLRRGAMQSTAAAPFSVGHIRSMAEPDEMASMQPTCPHAHSGPLGSIGMWPISPATKRVAAPQSTALDIAGGDAGADAEVGKVVDRAMFVRQVPIGAKRCGTNVVLDMHRHTELVGQARPEVDLVAADADVDREPNHAQQRVDGARNADADGVRRR